MNATHTPTWPTSGYTFDEDIVSDLHKDAYGFRPCEGFLGIVVIDGR